MTEINTFSAAVDNVVAIAARPDRKTDIIGYIRQTIRECQVLNGVFFKKDFIEDTIVATTTNYIWEYPQEFRILRTVRYPYIDNQGKHLYPPEILPGKKQKDFDYFYYGGPGYYVFKGIAVGDLVDLGYYSYSRKLPYYETASRPATFSVEDNAWSYLNPGTTEENEAARNLVSNWLLFNHFETIVEGGLAKIFKTVADERSTASYALYKSYQATLLAAEPSDSLNK